MPIVDKLKEALKPGRKDSADDGELGKLLASSAKKAVSTRMRAVVTESQPRRKCFSPRSDCL
uniref:Ubiquitin specific peptidase 36 n=1 Tax=Homo sapiens TaxID=9606 RepID=U3KQ92_HUMAN